MSELISRKWCRHHYIGTFYSWLVLCEVKNIKALHYRPFVKGIHRWRVDSPRKWSVMRCFGLLYVVNKLLTKQLRSQWFGIPWRSCDVTVMKNSMGDSCHNWFQAYFSCLLVPFVPCVHPLSSELFWRKALTYFFNITIDIYYVCQQRDKTQCRRFVPDDLISSTILFPSKSFTYVIHRSLNYSKRMMPGSTYVPTCT